MVGRFQLVDWSVSFLFKNYQNAAKRQFVWELISSEGARFYQKAKKENKIRRLHVFLSQNWHCWYLLPFLSWAAYCYEEKGEEMTLQQQQRKTKRNSKERYTPNLWSISARISGHPRRLTMTTNLTTVKGLYPGEMFFNIPTLNSIWFSMQQ